MNKIYHYTRSKTAIEHILPSRKLRTNFLHKMNDPKENHIWSFGGVNIDYKGIYPKTYSHTTHIEHQRKLGEDIKSKLQALSFVHSDKIEGYRNEMMWAQYGDNHQGVCFEIDMEKFLEENETAEIFKFQKVKYGNYEKPYLYWRKNISKENNIHNIIHSHFESLFLCKSDYWTKESELRLLLIKDEQCYLDIQKSLSGIYYGLLTSKKVKKLIKDFTYQDHIPTYNTYYERNKIKRMLDTAP